VNRILYTFVIVLVLWQGVLQAEEFNASDLGNRWYEHEQFGTFYDANNSEWYYHLDHGWIYVDEWDDNGTWMYVPLKDGSPIHTYYHFDGVNYTAVVDWDELEASTGLSLEFLKAVNAQSGNDPSLFENEGNQTINVTDKTEPFGWVWTKASTQNYFYNNRLEEWLFFNKDRLETEARYYSYKHKRYITSKEIRKRDYAQNIWKKMLSSYGFESFVNLGELNGIEVITDLDKDQLDGTDGFPVITSVNIPKTEIQKDVFWFPLIKTLTELQVDLKKYYRLSEDSNFYRLEIRSVFLNEVINSSSHDSTNATNHEVDAPDDERQASSKGLNDNGSKEAIALEKASLIDLNDDEQSAKVDYYIEVAVVASKMFEERNEERRFRRENWKPAELFVYDLVNNFDSVVDLTIEADIIGVKDDAMFDSLLEYAHNAADVKEVVQVASTIGANDKESLESVFKNVSQADSLNEVVQFAADLGAQNKENLGSVFKNADKADDLNEVMQVAAKALGTDDGSGNKKLGSAQASVMASTLKNADKADSMKSVMEDAASMGIQDATNLTSVFQNADQADNLKEVMSVAKQSLGSDNGTGGKSFNSNQASILASTLQNADKADSLKLVLAIAKDLGVQDEEHLTSVFVNAGNARDLITVCYAAVDTFGFDDGSGIKKLDSSKASILSSTLKNADKASQLKQVIEVSIELGINDAENLKPVFQNSEQATDLLEVIIAADEAGFEDKDTLTVVFQNSDRANDLMAVIEKTREINVQEAVELSSAFEVSLKVLDSKDSHTNEEIASLLSSQNGRLEDSNLSLAVDPEILILISELDEYSPSLPTYETAEVSINTEIEVSSSLLE
jgi:hypothetical protein